MQFMLPLIFFFVKNDRTDVDIFILNSEPLYLVIKILFTLLFSYVKLIKMCQNNHNFHGNKIETKPQSLQLLVNLIAV